MLKIVYKLDCQILLLYLKNSKKNFMSDGVYKLISYELRKRDKKVIKNSEKYMHYSGIQDIVIHQCTFYQKVDCSINHI